METFDYTIQTTTGFDQAVGEIEAKTKEKGFAVLHTHDIKAIFASKGIEREPLKLIEICNATYASRVLTQDIESALVLPCRISVYRKDGKTYISALRPRVIADLYPQADIGALAQEIDTIVLNIVDESK